MCICRANQLEARAVKQLGAHCFLTELPTRLYLLSLQVRFLQEGYYHLAPGGMRLAACALGLAVRKARISASGTQIVT